MSAQPHESTPGITAAERAYRHIKEKIISGEIPPRARLPESALASNLGISRTPVREALRRLEAEGFVDLAGFMGVALGGGEVAEAEVDLGEQAQRGGFIGLVGE